jgi:hypothetical protein
MKKLALVLTDVKKILVLDVAVDRLGQNFSS